MTEKKMYAYILSKLSKESMDEFKHHEDYQIVKGDLSVLGLWVVLREIHAINNSSNNLLILKKEAFEKYATCKQGPFETLADFKVRFDFMYECYVDQGNVEKTCQDRAIDFMYALDAARYGEFITEILNDVAKVAIVQPKDVNLFFFCWQIQALLLVRVVVSIPAHPLPQLRNTQDVPGWQPPEKPGRTAAQCTKNPLARGFFS